jgi:hypothetical protein
MRRLHLSILLAAAFTAGSVFAHAMPVPASVAAFRDLCDKAMETMMADMETPSTGDVDRDFVAMMIPHHQGAIDRAVAELRYGNDRNLQRIAQEIIVDQQQEIAAMRLALHEPLPPSVPAPTAPATPSGTHASQDSP